MAQNRGREHFVKAYRVYEEGVVNPVYVLQVQGMVDELSPIYSVSSQRLVGLRLHQDPWDFQYLSLLQCIVQPLLHNATLSLLQFIISKFDRGKVHNFLICLFVIPFLQFLLGLIIV